MTTINNFTEKMGETYLVYSNLSVSKQNLSCYFASKYVKLGEFSFFSHSMTIGSIWSPDGHKLCINNQVSKKKKLKKISF